jgi:creatinine amidohydrolase/Fe(II)-dependent formamide hydrolase-like protein
MSQAVAEMTTYPTRSIPAWTDLVAGRPAESSVVAWMPYWSTHSRSGVRGDTTKATAAKGEEILTAAAEGLAQLVTELRQLEIGPRVNHHE